MRDDGRPTYRCALLARTASGWFTDLLFATPRLQLFSLPETELGLTENLNPYQLPSIEEPDAILICMNWYQWLETQGDAVVDRVFSRLRSICDVLVGLEGFDLFSLRLPPAGLDRFDIVLKAQGVYRDRDLYNYEVGPYYPGANWTQKRRPSRLRYTPVQLEKLRLSLPCFIGVDRVVRMKVRRLKTSINRVQRAAREAGDWLIRVETALLDRLMPTPPHTAHCLVALSHIQRLELLLDLQAKQVSGLLGVSVVPEYIWGTERGEASIPEEERDAIRRTIQAHGLRYGPMNRNRFKRAMLSHKVVIAPTGYGELTFRHAEAWEQGRALVCQDLSHVETMHPFKDGENVLYCRPDCSDLAGLLRRVETGAINYKRIGTQGQRAWRAWIDDLDAVFAQGVLKHLDEATRRPAARALPEAELERART